MKSELLSRSPPQLHKEEALMVDGQCYLGIQNSHVILGIFPLILD